MTKKQLENRLRRISEIMSSAQGAHIDYSKKATGEYSGYLTPGALAEISHLSTIGEPVK